VEFVPDLPHHVPRKSAEIQMPVSALIYAWPGVGTGGNGKPLAMMLRPGNAGSNTAGDAIEVTGLDRGDHMTTEEI
jgi:hypothetical protein